MVRSVSCCGVRGSRLFCKNWSTIFIPNCHWNHTKFNIDMIPVVIKFWYEYHTQLQLGPNLIQACIEIFPAWPLAVASTIITGFGYVITINVLELCINFCWWVWYTDFMYAYSSITLCWDSFQYNVPLIIADLIVWVAIRLKIYGIINFTDIMISCNHSADRSEWYKYAILLRINVTRHRRATIWLSTNQSSLDIGLDTWECTLQIPGCAPIMIRYYLIS